MALFSRTHLLLRWKRPSLLLARRLSGGSVVTEGAGFHECVALQTATRAAAQAGVVLIRKTRLFEESHTFASMLSLGIRPLAGDFSPAYAESHGLARGDPLTGYRCHFFQTGMMIGNIRGRLSITL
jgi:hypothetical protein